MKIVAINTLPAGSTGSIMLGIGEAAKQKGHRYDAFAGNWKGYPSRDDRYRIFGSRIENMLSAFLSRVTGLQNCFSVFGTLSLISEIRRIDPDLIHLNNLHLNVINVPMLFRFIRKHRIPVIWTLHDCWPFTGHCPHFEMAGCDKWKTGCCDCPLYREYPKSVFDNSRKMYRKKKKWFSGAERITFAAVSDWICQRQRESFLSKYPCVVVHNGIDTSVFQPTTSDFRARNRLENKNIVLGVSYVWNRRKGLDVFCELAAKLPENYHVVLVGINSEIKKQLPAGITAIPRTESRGELAQIYSEADVFVNPTREEAFGLTNIEALACGTPVITFRSGGSPECLDKSCGSVVEKDDISDLISQICRVCEEKPFSKEACVARARQFDVWKSYEKYVSLYEEQMRLCEEHAV